MAGRVTGQTAGVEVAAHTFHSFYLQVLRDHVLDSDIAMHAGLISGTNQLAWSASSVAGAYTIANAGAARPFSSAV